MIYDIWYIQLHWIIVEVIKLLSQNYVTIHTSDMVCNVIELLFQNNVMIHTFDMVHKHRHFIQIPDKNKCCLFHVCQSNKYKMTSHFYFNLHFSDCWKCWTFRYMLYCSFWILSWDLSFHVCFTCFLWDKFEFFFVICKCPFYNHHLSVTCIIIFSNISV